MFSLLATVPQTPPGELAEVRLSLNTPVVAIEALPVGPAAAAIALRRSARGPRLVLALRSERSGQVIFFAPDDDWHGVQRGALPVDAALAFAESMGFLFDEGVADAREAARCWAEFLEDAGSGAEEPWLEGLIPPERPPSLEGVVPPERSPLLTKFRFAAVPAAGRVAAPLEGGEALRDVWVRLLSRF
jgi:hypothetical protein